jgi:hypothetical protein
MRTARWAVAMSVLLALAAGTAWALSDADTGALWVQAPSSQKIQVANILSRDLKMDPRALQSCLDRILQEPANAAMTIREAAQLCKSRQ